MRTSVCPEVRCEQLYPQEPFHRVVLPDYSDVLKDLPHYPKKSKEIAKSIDQIIEPSTIEVINSRRRWYKVFGKFPNQSECLAEIKSCKPDLEIDQETINQALETRNQIIMSLLPIANDWAQYCIKFSTILQIGRLTPIDIQSIAEETIIKVVDFRYVSKGAPSFGVGIIKLSYASIQRMILYHGFSMSTDVEELYQDLYADDSDFLERYVDQGTLNKNPEDILIELEERSTDYEYSPEIFRQKEEATPARENRSRTHPIHLEKFRALLDKHQITFEEVMHHLSALPIAYQSTLLHLFGYVEPSLNREKFSMQYSAIPPAVALQRLSTSITKGIVKDPFNLPEMIQNATNVPLILNSLYLDRQKESLYIFLAAFDRYQKISIKDRPRLTPIEQTVIQTILNNLKHHGVTPLRTTKAIRQELSRLFSKPVDHKLFSQIITQSLIPAMKGSHHAPITVLEKLLEPQVARQKPTQLVDNYLETFGLQWIYQHLELTDIHKRILQAMHDNPNESLVKIGRKVGFNPNYVGSCVHTIAKKLRAFSSKEPHDSLLLSN